MTASTITAAARPDTEIRAALERVREFIEPRLAASLTASPEAAPRLVDAMRYALLAPGKRLRPALVLWAAQACGGTWDAAAPAAVSVEMIHAYSLVHDDLPAMDDDDLRRGRPTCHRAFDEATAILCGDALQALAFEILATGMPAAHAARGCAVLARAAGAEALVGGQVDDLAAERGWIADLRSEPPAVQVAWMERINRRKTGALFHAALQLGGLAAAADDANSHCWPPSATPSGRPSRSRTTCSTPRGPKRPWASGWARTPTAASSPSPPCWVRRSRDGGPSNWRTPRWTPSARWAPPPENWPDWHAGS